MTDIRFERIIAIPDLHGCYEHLRQLFEQEIRFNPEKDKIVFLGDYIDFREMTDIVDRAGVSSAKVVQYVSDLKQRYPENIVLLKGNHEEMAETALTTDNSLNHNLWIFNGGIETIDSFGGMERAREALLPFIETLEPYHETDSAIFVHGGLPSDRDMDKISVHDMLWGSGRYSGEKLLVVGHRVTDKIYKDGNKISIDLGCFSTGRLIGVDVLSRRVYEVANLINSGDQ